MTAGDINNVRVTEATQAGSNGKVESIIRVQFNVGQHGPFVEVFKKDSFDPVAANTKLQTFANTLAMLPGN